MGAVPVNVEADRLIRRGAELSAAGAPDAQEPLEEAVSLTPEDPDILVRAASLSFDNGHYERAREFLTRAREHVTPEFDLVPAMALLVLIAQRVARSRAEQSPLGARGGMHVRLVALFSVLAAVPTLLVVIFASLLFQNTDILMGSAFVGAAQEEIGFPLALGIRHNNVRRNDRIYKACSLFFGQTHSLVHRKNHSLFSRIGMYE